MTSKALLAYEYYANSRRKNNHDPVAYHIWRRAVSDEQIEEMVRLYRLE